MLGVQVVPEIDGDLDRVTVDDASEPCTSPVRIAHEVLLHLFILDHDKNRPVGLRGLMASQQWADIGETDL
jgi:hypothetical protein